MQAIPNPIVEERRELPEVECTFWEPYRPYLSGDIVCRFEIAHYAAGPFARTYELTAYACSYRNHDSQSGLLAQIYEFDDYFNTYTAHGECSGATWESI